jgi:hypothetical protein
MKEFGNVIKVFFLSDVEKIENGIVIPKTGKTPDTFHTAEFSLNPQMESPSVAVLHSIDATLYVDKVSREVAKRYEIIRSVIIQLCTGSDTPVAMGSIEYPAKVSITQHLQADILTISHKSPYPYQF